MSEAMQFHHVGIKSYGLSHLSFCDDLKKKEFSLDKQRFFYFFSVPGKCEQKVRKINWTYSFFCYTTVRAALCLFYAKVEDVPREEKRKYAVFWHLDDFKDMSYIKP